MEQRSRRRSSVPSHPPWYLEGLPAPLVPPSPPGRPSGASSSRAAASSQPAQGAAPPPTLALARTSPAPLISCVTSIIVGYGTMVARGFYYGSVIIACFVQHNDACRVLDRWSQILFGFVLFCTPQWYSHSTRSAPIGPHRRRRRLTTPSSKLFQPNWPLISGGVHESKE